MNSSTRGRAIVARVRRPLSWGVLAALWTLQASGSLQWAAAWRDGASDVSLTTIRASWIDDIIDDILGDPVPPPPPDNPTPPDDETAW